MSIYDPNARAERLSARVGMTMLRLSQTVKRLTTAEVRETGLTPVQAQTILFVQHTKTFLTSVGRLASMLGTSHVTAVGVVDGLVKRGLLDKAEDPSDGRVTLLRLTPEGQQAAQQLADFGKTLEEALSTLDADQLAKLEQALGGLVWSLRAAGVLQVAEPCRGCVHFAENAQPSEPLPHGCQLIDIFISEEESRRDCPDFTPEALQALMTDGPVHST